MAALTCAGTFPPPSSSLYIGVRSPQHMPSKAPTLIPELAHTRMMHRVRMSASFTICLISSVVGALSLPVFRALGISRDTLAQFTA